MSLWEWPAELRNSPINILVPKRMLKRSHLAEERLGVSEGGADGPASSRYTLIGPLWETEVSSERVRELTCFPQICG